MVQSLKTGLTGWTSWTGSLTILFIILFLAEGGGADVTGCGGATVSGAPAACCCVGTVGNVDCDHTDGVDIMDVTRLIDYLFISYRPLMNYDEANIDGLPGIDIADLTMLIDYMFLSGAPLMDCPEPYNTPPETRIWGSMYYSTVINAVEEGIPGTGFAIEYYGEDLVDHPYGTVDLEFEWRLYGPYRYRLDEDSTDKLFEQMYDLFVKTVYHRTNGEVYVRGRGESCVIFDTVVATISCDTVLVDTIQAANPLGILDTMFLIDDPAFANDTSYNKIALWSGDGGSHWSNSTSDTLYDLFNSAPSDSTIQRKFILWGRARETGDTLAVDPTPDFALMNAVDPKREHDIAIWDVQTRFEVNSRKVDSAKAFWGNAIHAWNGDIEFDSEQDYIVGSRDYGFHSMYLRRLLSYKTIIVVEDNPFQGALGSVVEVRRLGAAISAGLNVWLCGRAMFAGGEAQPPDFDPKMLLSSSSLTLLSDRLGVEDFVYSGWEYYIYNNSYRIEDFVGAKAALSGIWPDIVLDTARLHSQYAWLGHYPWVDTIAALPEVDYMVPTAEAQVLYTYQSLYGADHWLDDTLFNFQDKVVAVRLETDHFRSSYFRFTPYSLEPTVAQTVVDSVLNWLTEPRSGPLLSVPDSNRRREER